MHSTRPYLVRALYQWIADNQMTPHLTVDANYPGVRVPKQYIQDGKIILNISPSAVDDLSLENNSWVTFSARFSGVLQEIRLPTMSIMAVYAAENGRGMVFDPEETPPDDGGISDGDSDPLKKPDGKPHLEVVK